MHEEKLCYLWNGYYSPVVKDFFIEKGVNIDEDEWALSELVQWMFRSCVREIKPINMYIPSSRMRNLLIKWLE